MRDLDQRVFITNGGGTTSIPGAKLYFYIVGQDIDKKELADDTVLQGKQDFYKLGASTSGGYYFCVIDISYDDRLRAALSKTDDGHALFNNIVDNMPALVISEKNLTDLSGIKSVLVTTITDFTKSVDDIKSRLNSQPISEKNRVLAFISKANEVVVLKPSFLGFGVDLNRLLKVIMGAA